MMILVPAVIGVTPPVDSPIIATEVLPLSHVPPPLASVKVADTPEHTSAGIEMAAGSGFTVIILVTGLQDNVVYDIVVVPKATPVTTPVAEMVAAAVLLLVHAPPAVVFARVIVVPGQTVDGPVIAAGIGLTLTMVVAVQVPPSV